MRRILVVDDSPTMRRMVIFALRELPDSVFVEAANGLEAIEQLALGHFHLIVLDINMPDMNGTDTIKFLRGHSAYRQVPVLVLSTTGDEESRVKALELGADSYVTKPFSPRSFVAEVDRLLGIGN